MKQQTNQDSPVYLLEWQQMPRPIEDARSTESEDKRASKAEGTIWTPRMLATLRKEGGKVKVWHSLIDKVWNIGNLREAFAKVKANRGAAGIDRISIEQYSQHLEENLTYLSEQLRSGSYQPKPIRRSWIAKAGKKKACRPIGISAVRDRVAQRALCNVIEPIYEASFAPTSYGFRPHRSAKDALRKVKSLLSKGKCHVLDADIQGYFDHIDHDILMSKIRQRISDQGILNLIELYLKCPVVDQGVEEQPEKGSPQGTIISPLLANIYLNELDHEVASKGWHMVRYADDFMILCDGAEELESAHGLVREWCHSHKLTLHPEKTKKLKVTSKEGIDFLGYHLRDSNHWISDGSIKRLRDKIRPLTRRKQGKQLSKVIDQLNPILRGYYNYFKHARAWQFKQLDGWIRMRLRSILRKWRGAKGRGRGSDHQRYQNHYFEERGLFSLEKARLEKQ